MDFIPFVFLCVPLHTKEKCEGGITQIIDNDKSFKIRRRDVQTPSPLII